MIECPTCGTPDFCHPDRIKGEDALPLPPERLARGVFIARIIMPTVPVEILEVMVKHMFREMLAPQEKKP